MSAFGDLRVVDLSEGVAAAFCAKLFADGGADVVKVEPPGGDPVRRLGPFLGDVPGPDASGLFAYLNVNKRGLCLDAGDPASRERVVELVRCADVVIEDRAPGGPRAAGLDPEALRELNPALVVTSITPFGRTGPWREYVATDFTLFHAGGTAYANGWRAADLKAEPPLAMTGHAASFLAGLAGAAATVAALVARQSLGTGDHLDIAVQEVLASNMRGDLSYVSYRGRKPTRSLAGIMSRALVGLQPARDGYIDFFLAGEGEWQAFLDLLGDPEWARNELFADARSRAVNWDAIELLLGEETRRFSKHELYALSQRRDLPASPVNTVADAAGDEHFRERAAFSRFSHPVLGECRCPGPLLRTGPLVERSERPSPLLEQLEHDSPWNAREQRPLEPGRSAEQQPPLAGVRICDLTWMYAGPYGTELLASLGAQVIKVESFAGKDLRGGRPWADGISGLNRSGVFNALNAGKQSIALDLRRPDHLRLVRELVCTSDVVTENFSVGTMDRFGLDYASLRALRPDLIMVSCSGFGQTGPAKRNRAFYSTVQAYSGLSSTNGYPGGWPKSPGGAWADYVAGNALAFAAGAALYARKRTGQGQHVDLAMTEVIMAMMGEPFLDYFLNGRVAVPRGNTSAVAAPHNVYPCAGEDAWVAIAVEDEAQWRALCQVVGDAALQAGAFADVVGRKAHEAELDALLAAWTADKSAWEVTALLQAAGVPSAPSCSAADLVIHPQLRSRGFVLEQEHPEVGRRTMMGSPLTSHGGVPAAGGRAPLFCEHNAGVIRGLLGHGSDVLREIESLQAELDRRTSGENDE